MPLVSVVIPAYNAAATIAATIDSVLRQTCTDLELIVIDDGSTDATASIVANLAEPRLRLHSFENRGLSASRNRGIDLASGRYLSFLDADDLWSPDKLEAQIEALRRRPEAGVAYSWTCSIDAAGRILYGHEPVRYEGDVYAPILCRSFISNGSNVLLRRAVIDQVGGFDESLSCGEDWDYAIRAAARWPFALVARYQIYYRQHASSMSRDLQRLHTNCLRVIERSFAAAPPPLQKWKPYSIAYVHLYLARVYLAWGHDEAAVRQAADCIRTAWQATPSALFDRAALRLLLRWAVTRTLSYDNADRMVALYRRHMVNWRHIPPPVSQ